MPIAIGDQIYEDELHYNASLLGIPVEGRTEEQSQGGTPVPAEENNAPAGNVGGKRGIVDQLLGSTGERYQTWPEKAVRGAVQAFALPGDVLSGKVQPGSSQEIERAADLAGMMIFGPAPVAGKMADGTLGSFIGVKAKTFNKNELAQAQIMEAQGIHPDDIFRDTGMFRSLEGRWKSEIPDKEAKLTQDWNVDNTSVKLKDILDHPELYKAYPELKNIDVKYDQHHPSASYDSVDNLITVGPNFVNHRETYLHEIQHAIQSIEGFAKGGAPVTEPKLRFDDDIRKLITEATEMSDRVKASGKLSQEDRDRFGYIQKVLKLNILRKEAAKSRALENYMRLAGETEARNVEIRALLGPENRNYSPWYSMDRAANEQVVSETPVWATPYGYAYRPDFVPK